MTNWQQSRRAFDDMIYTSPGPNRRTRQDVSYSVIVSAVSRSMEDNSKTGCFYSEPLALPLDSRNDMHVQLLELSHFLPTPTSCVHDHIPYTTSAMEHCAWGPCSSVSNSHHMLRHAGLRAHWLTFYVSLRRGQEKCGRGSFLFLLPSHSCFQRSSPCSIHQISG